MAELKVHFEDAEFSIGTVENCLIWSFRTGVTLDRIQRSKPVHLELKREYPKFAVMTIVGENISLSMPADARELSTMITKEFQPYYCGVCEVIEGKGFGASVARSTAPARVFSDVGTASSWLGALMNPADPEKTVKKLTAAAERIRAPKK